MLLIIAVQLIKIPLLLLLLLSSNWYLFFRFNAAVYYLCEGGKCTIHKIYNRIFEI